MRILFDHQCFSTQKYGGISRYFLELASHLNELDEVSVEMFAPLYLNEYMANSVSIRPRGIKIPHISRGSRVLSMFNSVVTHWSLRNRTNIDIFHETYYSQLDCCPSSAICVLTVFDMIHEKFPEFFPPRNKTIQLKAEAVRRADHVICISENTRRDLVELTGVDPQKTSVVYLGHSLQTDNSVAHSPIDARQRFVLYVGTRGGYKNFSAVVKALVASRLPAAGFKLVCFGGGSLSGAEVEFMREQQLDLSLVSCRSGGDDVLASLYRQATLLIYPSLYEGFGIPPLEAMALGCPVACTNSSSLPEVVGTAAELFDPSSRDQIVAALEAIALSPTRAEVLADLGRERAKLFSWKKCAEDTLQVYQRLCAG